MLLQYSVSGPHFIIIIIIIIIIIFINEVLETDKTLQNDLTDKDICSFGW